MEKKLLKLYSYLHLNNFKTEAKEVFNLLKLAADLVLNKNTYNEIYKSIKDYSMNYINDELLNSNLDKINSTIENVFSAMTEKNAAGDLKFILFKNKRGDQLNCLKWCTVQALDEISKYKKDLSKENYSELISIFATLISNKSKFYYSELHAHLYVVNEESMNEEKMKYIKSEEFKEEGYKKLSKLTNFFQSDVFDFEKETLINNFNDNNITMYDEKIRQKKVISEGIQEIYRDEDFTISFIKNHEACNLNYFKSTSWCITEESDYHWDKYSSEDNLHFYVIEKYTEKNKQEPMRKIAIPFKYEKIFEKELRDKDDNSIKMEDIEKYLGDNFEKIFSF